MGLRELNGASGWPGLRPLEPLRSKVASLLFSRLRRLPLHIGIIPDGNRRWARRRGLKPWLGHVAGYVRLRRILDKLWELGVRYVTVYAMSFENCLRRPMDERRFLYALFSKALDDLVADRRVSGGLVRVRVVGELSMVPASLREKIRWVEEQTSGNGPHRLSIGLCYSGRWELLEAVKNILARGCKGVSEEELRRSLALGDLPEPDLIVRTGGEIRVSNFMLWHIAYSELYFTRTLWPDFDDLELARALLDYQSRERRFGA